MKTLNKSLGQASLALTLAIGLVGAPVGAQSLSAQAERDAEIARLLAELATPGLPTWASVEQKVIRLWSQSGSHSADLLLERGEAAIEDEDYGTAIEHLTALTDHAPDFAEGWHMRATAFYLAEEFGLARADLLRALALNPSHFGALSGLAIIHEESGEYEAALAVMEHAQAINPHREMIGEAITRLKARLGRSQL